jgi:hypothetical protein
MAGSVNKIIDYTFKVTGAEKASEQFGNLGKAAKVGVVELAAIAAAATLASKALWDLMQSSANTASAINDGAAMANIAIDDYQALNYVLQMTTEVVDGAGQELRAINNFLLSAESGTGRQADALATMNLRYEDLIRMDPAQRFSVITDAIGTLTDATEQNLTATEVFGTRYATQIVAALNQTDGSLTSMMDSFKESSMIIGTDNVVALEGFGDMIDRGKIGITALKAELAAGLTPAFTELLDTLGELAPELKEELMEAIPMLADIVGNVASDIEEYGPGIVRVISVVIDALGWLQKAQDDTAGIARWVQMSATGGLSEIARAVLETETEVETSIGLFDALAEARKTYEQRTGTEFNGIGSAISGATSALSEYANQYLETAAVTTGAGGMGTPEITGKQPGIMDKSQEVALIQMRAEAEMAAMDAVEEKRLMQLENSQIREEEIYAARIANLQGVADQSIGIIMTGFQGGFDSVIDGFKGMLGQMAQDWLKSQILRLLFDVGKTAVTSGAGKFIP